VKVFIVISVIITGAVSRPTADEKTKHVNHKMAKLAPVIIFPSSKKAPNLGFNSVQLLNHHASAHKTIKKRIEVKKTLESLKTSRSQKTTVKPPTTICIPMVTESSDSEKQNAIRSNTIFTSHNWGNQK
jgi:hypothetical protein